LNEFLAGTRPERLVKIAKIADTKVSASPVSSADSQLIGFSFEANVGERIHMLYSFFLFSGLAYAGTYMVNSRVGPLVFH